MADLPYDHSGKRRLQALEKALQKRGRDLAVLLVYDRPSLVEERPGLARTFFAERCVPDSQLHEMSNAFRAIGAHVEIFDGDHRFLEALADGRHGRIDRSLLVAYNGLGYSVGDGAFRPGRKSLIPLVADSYGFTCANSDAYACAFTLHKFHCFTLLYTLGVNAPMTWGYEPATGWINGLPPIGTKVIAKSNYESWAVGVTPTSVFTVDDLCTERVSTISEAIGQAVVVQEFISGLEVYVPVLSCPELVAAPPVESILKRGPHDHDAFVTIDDNLSEDSLSYRRFDSSDTVQERLCREAKQIFGLLQMEGLGRIDFRVDAKGQPWVIDVAISPGMEVGGSASKSLAEFGFEHPSFIRLAVAASLATRGLLAA